MEIRVARCALLSHNSQKLLLLRRAMHNATGQGQWECPGGKCLDGESCYDTVDMEILQETGLKHVVVENKFIEVDRAVPSEGPCAGTTFLTFFTQAHDESRGDPVLLEEDHDACVWVTYEEALTYDLTPQTRKGLIAIRERIQMPK
ncbi:MAG: NUDIX domain-containing protein [Patescibacteria group bacterium]